MPTPERYLIEKSLHIVDKERRVVPFALNPTQVLFDSNFTGHDIVAKARQKGVTSLYLGRHLMSCISQDHQVCALISHESQATMRHLGRVHWMLEKLRETASVEVGRASQYEITFPRTHSHYYIGTAGSKNFGRGETISKLHMTEVAFWENASEIALGLMQAVPASGEIGIESTGNGQGNWFHRQVMAANNGDGAYRLHFFPWNIDDEYRKLLSPGQTASLLTNLNEEWDEPRLIREFSLTAEQLAWRRDKIVNECDYDLDKFKQEYPLTLDECFRASGGSVFQKINFVRTPEWQRSTDDRRLQLLSGHPHPAQTYCIGADASGGVMKDSSVAIVFNRTTGEQVGEWASNSTPPDSFGRDVLPTLGMLFNGALIVVESNNHGIAVLDNLRNNYQSGLIYESPVGEKKQEGMLLRLGFRTTQKTKPLVIGRIRRAMRAAPS